MAFDFPASPVLDDLYEPVDGPKYKWNGFAWTKVAGGAGGGASIEVSDTPPPTPADKALWYESDSGGLFLRYNDGNTTQWIQVNPSFDTSGMVKKTGDTMSGDLTISKVAPILSLDKAASAQDAYIRWNTGGVQRWLLNCDSTAESGSNAGSALAIYNYNDAGAYLGVPLSINRATGKVTATGLPAIQQMAAGLGQILSAHPADGVAVYLPAGGTWFYFFWGTAANMTFNAGLTGGVAAGGTLICNGVAGYRWMYLLWRIA